MSVIALQDVVDNDAENLGGNQGERSGSGSRNFLGRLRHCVGVRSVAETNANAVRPAKLVSKMGYEVKRAKLQEIGGSLELFD